MIEKIEQLMKQVNLYSNLITSKGYMDEEKELLIIFSDLILGLDSRDYTTILKSHKRLSHYILFDLNLNKTRALNLLKVNLDDLEKELMNLLELWNDQNKLTLQRNSKITTRFRALNLAIELADTINNLCMGFPEYERHNVIKQIRKSSMSNVSLIAAGNQLNNNIKIDKWSRAIGSIQETIAWLELSGRLHYVEVDKSEQLKMKAMEIVKMLTSILNKLIRNSPHTNLYPIFIKSVNSFTPYKISLEIVLEIYSITTCCPFEYTVQDIRKKASSIFANIAEAEQITVKLKYSHWNMSLTAINEVRALIELDVFRNKFSKEKNYELRERLLVVEKVLKKTMKNKKQASLS